MIIRLHFVLLLILSLLFAVTISAQAQQRILNSTAAHTTNDFAQAVTVFQGGDYEAARGLLEQLVDAGDTRAQSLLGWMLYDGIFVQADVERSIRLVQAAANRGDAHANLVLAIAYENGEGVRQNDKMAMVYLQIAARRQDPDAQMLLGTYYMSGTIVDRDPKRAMKWLAQAGRNGSVEAEGFIAARMIWSDETRVNDELAALLMEREYDGTQAIMAFLGVINEHGLGVDRDLIEAIKWYTLATYGVGDLENPEVDFADRPFADAGFKAEAERRALLWLIDAAQKPETHFGKAARWCLDFKQGEIDCLKTAIAGHQECKAPYFPRLFADYFYSEAYKYCRRYYSEQTQDAE